MANYDYKCNSCNEVSTISKSMMESDRVEYCSKCNSEMVRVYKPTPIKWNCSGAYGVGKN